MIARMIEVFKGYPQLEIAPDGYNLEHWTGRATVTPLHLDLDLAKYALSPEVDVNVSLGKFSNPDKLIEWAEVIKVSAMIAKREFAPWFSASVNDAAMQLWALVDEIIKP